MFMNRLFSSSVLINYATVNIFVCNFLRIHFYYGKRHTNIFYLTFNLLCSFISSQYLLTGFSNFFRLLFFFIFSLLVVFTVNNFLIYVKNALSDLDFQFYVFKPSSLEGHIYQKSKWQYFSKTFSWPPTPPPPHALSVLILTDLTLV